MISYRKMYEVENNNFDDPRWWKVIPIFQEQYYSPQVEEESLSIRYVAGKDTVEIYRNEVDTDTLDVVAHHVAYMHIDSFKQMCSLFPDMNRIANGFVKMTPNGIVFSLNRGDYVCFKEEYISVGNINVEMENLNTVDFTERSMRPDAVKFKYDTWFTFWSNLKEVERAETVICYYCS